MFSEERRKPEYSEKTLSVQRRNPSTNATYTLSNEGRENSDDKE